VIARIEHRWQGEVPVAAVVGELDASNAREFGERLRSLLTNQELALVVDLSPTGYLDSAGLNLLFALAAELRGRQQRLAVVVQPGSPIERMIEITGLGESVLVRPTVADALVGLEAG
jgi:anti-anti-sigma factor